MNFRSAIAALMIGSSVALASMSVSAQSQNNAHSKAPEKQETVNINNANAKILSMDLDGIGPVKAKAIVSYRNAHGDYKRVQDLTKVKGIGSRTVAENRSHIRLK